MNREADPGSAGAGGARRWLDALPPAARTWITFETVFLASLLAWGLHPSSTLLTELLIFAILALGLNVVTGYTGLLHLGIAAFFGIGAYITGILTVPGYPFQVGFWYALIASTLGAAAMGVVLGAPTLRLRGDYLAIVTLGFGEVVKFMLKNFEEITKGARTLSPIPPPNIPGWGDRHFYFLALAALAVVVALLKNLENSRLGRAWMAIREDELAATCMGIGAARVKLSAFALGSALAGLAGCLYATKLTTTAGPDAFDFSRSVAILCCMILGGLGSLRGTLLGVFLLLGFDNILTPQLDRWLAEANLIRFSTFRFMVFGLALILMMRFRPEGILPSSRVRDELHPERDQPAPVRPKP